MVLWNLKYFLNSRISIACWYTLGVFISTIKWNIWIHFSILLIFNYWCCNNTHHVGKIRKPAQLFYQKFIKFAHGWLYKAFLILKYITLGRFYAFKVKDVGWTLEHVGWTLFVSNCLKSKLWSISQNIHLFTNFIVI